MAKGLSCVKREGGWACEAGRVLELEPGSWRDIDFERDALAFWEIELEGGKWKSTDKKWYVIARLPDGKFLAVESDVDAGLSGVGLFSSLQEAAAAIVKRLLQQIDIEEKDVVEVSTEEIAEGGMLFCFRKTA